MKWDKPSEHYLSVDGGDHWRPVSGVKVVFQDIGGEDAYTTPSNVVVSDKIEFRKGVERGDEDTREVEYQVRTMDREDGGFATTPWPEVKGLLDKWPGMIVSLSAYGHEPPKEWRRVAPEERRGVLKT